MTVGALIFPAIAIFVLRSRNYKRINIGLFFVHGKVIAAIYTNVVGLHTGFQTVCGMYWISSFNNSAIIMACRNNHILFAGDLTGRCSILKPQAAVTGVVSSLAILGTGRFKACNLGCIVGMLLAGITAIVCLTVATAAAAAFSALLANNFTIAAGIAAGTKSGCAFFAYFSAFAAHHCTVFTAATFGAPFKRAASTQLTTAAAQLLAIAAGIAIAAPAFGAILTNCTAIIAHIYTIFTGIAFLTPFRCAIPAQIIAAFAQFYTICTGTAVIAELSAILTNTAKLTELGAILADAAIRTYFCAVLTVFTAAVAKYRALLAGAFTADTDRRAVPANAAVFTSLVRAAVGAFLTDWAGKTVC